MTHEQAARHIETQTLDTSDDEAPRDEQATDERPRVWVGPERDYIGARQYGEWVDATADPLDVFATIRAIIDRTPDAGAQRWSVFDISGFGPWQPGPVHGLADALHVARGIAQFGLPYAGLASAVGIYHRSTRWDRFPQVYLGNWPTLPAFANHFLTESGWDGWLRRLPDAMQPYIRIEMDHLMRDMRRELRIVEHQEGIWVYDPRRW
jgi:hypothetical protein